MSVVIGLYRHEKITLVFDQDTIYVYSIYGNFSFYKYDCFSYIAKYEKTHFNGWFSEPIRMNCTFCKNEGDYGLLFYKIGEQFLVALIFKGKSYNDFDKFSLPKDYTMKQYYYLLNFTNDLLYIPV